MRGREMDGWRRRRRRRRRRERWERQKDRSCETGRDSDGDGTR